jgi:eukaryotic-like serine/threonine-protein kinase
MPAKIVLTITQGQLSGTQYVYEEREVCTIGRHRDCNVRLPSDAAHAQVSRYHCLLDINPPSIRVRDLGSGNGTYVNGQRVGFQQESIDQQPERLERDLVDGDLLQIGYTAFEVRIEDTSSASSMLSQSLETQAKRSKFILPDNRQAADNLLALAAGDHPSLAGIRGYTIIKILGAGKCGAVYLAQNDRTEEMVALKVMLPQVAVNDRAVKMFIREMANTQVLHHPNVVRTIDYGEAENIFYFTMECCHEGSVSDFIVNQGGKIPLKIAISITLQVLAGLEYTHNAVLPAVRLADGSIGEGQGLVHRDLKPANIFLQRVGDKTLAKIGDYGLAKAFELAGMSGQTMTGQGGVMGTPSFMSRQQLLNTKYVQPAVDVWATAACLYNMLTGVPPRNFGKRDPLQVILRDEAVPILERDPNIPKPLAAVIDRALWEDPRNHHDIFYKRAIDFRNALAEALSQ